MHFFSLVIFRPHGQCGPLPTVTSSRPASLLSLALSLGPISLLPALVSSQSLALPPGFLFKMLGNIFTFCPGLVFSGLSQEWQKNRTQYSTEGRGILQHSTLCCCKFYTWEMDSTHMLLHAFQDPPISVKYSQWDFFNIESLKSKHWLYSVLYL